LSVEPPFIPTMSGLASRARGVTCFSSSFFPSSRVSFYNRGCRGWYQHNLYGDCSTMHSQYASSSRILFHHTSSSRSNGIAEKSGRQCSFVKPSMLSSGGLVAQSFRSAIIAVHSPGGCIVLRKAMSEYSDNGAAEVK
jgi:hypothetical protein